MLTNYLTDTASLLRDSNFRFTSQKQMTRWINSGRRQIALITHCLRTLVPGQVVSGAQSTPGFAIPGAATPGAEPATFNTIVNVERYPFVGFANPYVAQYNQGYKGILDVLDVAVSWGGNRPSLDWMPWDDLQAYARAYAVGVYSYPFLWSNIDGERGQVWLFPVPALVTEMEWDVACAPLDIWTNDDYEALPEEFQPAVKFYAAHMCYYGSQRFGQAEVMLNHFHDTLGVGRTGIDAGKTKSYYSGINGV